MSSARSLVDLPTELLQRVLLWTLFIDAQAEIALLLTCKSLKDQTESAANNGAWKYAIEHYGNPATIIFAPARHQNLLHDWLPRFEQAMERIDEVLDAISAEMEARVERLGRGGTAVLASEPEMDANINLTTIAMGLCFFEAIHFQRHQSSDGIRKLLTWLLPHEWLIMRQVSVVIADVFSRRIRHELSDSGRSQKVDALRKNRSLMIRVIEYEMLLHGASILFDIIRAAMPDPVEGKYSNKREHRVAEKKVGEENVKRTVTRSKALEHIVGTVSMLQMYQEFPAGPLQDKELTKMISKSIAANYGDVPALPNKGEDVGRFLALVAAEVDGKSEVEILTEMKATLEI